MSDALMITIIVEYLIIAGFCAYEHRWLFVVYWLSAALLNLAVFGMGRK
jgi:hypothetical protein